MSIRTEMGLRIMAAALLLGAAAYVFFTFFLAEEDQADVITPSASDPAAYAVAEVLEEARRITREASSDDAR
jgi:hypothetical protein